MCFQVKNLHTFHTKVFYSHSKWLSATLQLSCGGSKVTISDTYLLDLTHLDNVSFILASDKHVYTDRALWVLSFYIGSTLWVYEWTGTIFTRKTCSVFLWVPDCSFRTDLWYTQGMIHLSLVIYCHVQHVWCCG